MKTTWKIQEARNQFDKLVENAIKSGPQYVTRRGVKTLVIILSYFQYYYNIITLHLSTNKNFRNSQLILIFFRYSIGSPPGFSVIVLLLP